MVIGEEQSAFIFATQCQIIRTPGSETTHQLWDTSRRSDEGESIFCASRHKTGQGPQAIDNVIVRRYPLTCTARQNGQMEAGYSFCLTFSTYG